MKLINRSQVPQYLQKGSFFEALDPNDDEKFGVPSDCLKPDLTITSDEDLKQLLRSVRFWSVYKMPVEVLSYFMKTAATLSDPLLAEFPEFRHNLLAIRTLKKCKPANTVALAMALNLGLQAIVFLHEDMGFVLDSVSWAHAARYDDISCINYLEEKEIVKGMLTSKRAKLFEFFG